jgi:phosphoribosyl-ATP pyrophosphohydrolase
LSSKPADPTIASIAAETRLDEQGHPMNDTTSIFARLMAVIEDRKTRGSEKSYTTTLLAGGVAKIGDKIREEAAEIVAAAGEPGPAGRDHTIHEAADCIYHLFVLLAHRDISLSDVEAELERRFGTSGLAEKAARPPGDVESQPGPDFPS